MLEHPPTNARQASGLLQWTVRSTAELEMAFSAFERVLGVSDAAPRELDAPPEQLDARREQQHHHHPAANAPADALAVAPMDGWPSRGAIAIDDATLRYSRPTLAAMSPFARDVTRAFIYMSLSLTQVLARRAARD